MKKFLVCILLLVIAFPVFSQQDLPLSRRITDDQLRQATFDNLVKSTNYSNASTVHACPVDVTSTGTASVAYLGTVTGPLLLRIQNLNTSAGKIRFKEYSTGTAGIASTVAADPFLPSPTGAQISTYTSGELGVGEVFEKVYYGEPDLIFGGIDACSFTVQIFKQSTAE